MTVAIKSPFRYSHTMGLIALTGRGFSNPVDVGIGKDGLLYVLNRANSYQAQMGAVRVTMCKIDETYIGDFAGFGTGDGQLTWPTSIALDSQGRVYVSDEHRHDVQVFDGDGEFHAKWGSFGAGEGQFNRPSGLAIDRDDNVIVVDNLNNRVQKLTPDGRPIAVFGEAGSGNGQFNLPWGVGVDHQGQIYVADWRNDRVQKFSPDGRYLATIGTPGSEAGQLKRPASVSVDLDGNVYVADWGNERAQVFTPDGGSLAVLAGDATVSKWAAEWLAGNDDIRQQRTEAVNLDEEKRFWGPTAVEVDDQGHVLVVDSFRHRVQIYQKD